MTTVGLNRGHDLQRTVKNDTRRPAEGAHFNFEAQLTQVSFAGVAAISIARPAPSLKCTPA